MKISATIITLNEEKKLARALESLVPVVDEIVVVDSGSADSTESIARHFTDRFLFNKWPGYAAQKNYAAAQASNDWILSLDADECLSSELQHSIIEIKKTPLSVAGYKFPRKTLYIGRWIEHSGWYPDRKIRLYDRNAGRWEGQFVHESVKVDGEVGTLFGDLLHYSIDSIFDHAKVANRYTGLAAEEMFARNRRARITDFVFLPSVTFVKSYLLQQGFRDGLPGFCIASFAAYYVFLKYAKLWELWHQPNCSKEESAAKNKSAGNGK